MRSFRFMFINYQQYIPKLGMVRRRRCGCVGVGVRNIICCTTGSFLGCCGPWPCLFADSMCAGGGKKKKEEDLRFNLRTRWRANTDVRSEK